jgi:hypothetical protein
MCEGRGELVVTLAIGHQSDSKKLECGPAYGYAKVVLTSSATANVLSSLAASGDAASTFVWRLDRE